MRVNTILDDNLNVDGFFRKKLTSSQNQVHSADPMQFTYDCDSKMSFNSLYRHYINRECLNLDMFDGFLDLNYVKHIRIGCLDLQTFSQLQMIAKKYSIFQLEQNNVISIIYGLTFAENR